MRKKIFTLLTLMLAVCSGAWADDTVLFTTDFSDDSWSSYTSESPITAQSTVNDIYFNCADYVANNALYFGADGNASGARYCAIHVTGVNGSVKITINYNAKARIKYRIIEETGHTTGMGSSTDPGANDDKNTIVNYNMTGEGDELTFYFYRQGSGAKNVVTGITITTPDASVQQYTATFANGGHGTAPSSIKAASVTLPTIGASWYTNTGWVANQDVTVNEETVIAGTAIACGTSVAMSANTTFTAQWASSNLPYVSGVTFASKPTSALNVANETATNGYVTYNYQADLRPSGTKAWATENSGGSASGQKWSVPEGSPFVGNSEGVNVTAVTASAKTYTVLFTGTTEVQVIGNSRKNGVNLSAMLVDYTSTPSIVETKTVGNLGSDGIIAIASDKIMKFENLEDCKTYAIFFYAADGQNSLLYEIAFKQPTTISGTITPAGWSTFTSNYALDLSTISDGTAYYASEASESTVTLTSTTKKVPAGTGLMIKGTAGETFTIATTSEETTDLSGSNLLKGQRTTGNVAASGTDGKYHYVFGFVTETPTIYGFYNLTADTEVAAGKAYLETNTALTTGARALTIVFDDDATGINDVKSVQKNDNRYYNLNGLEVAQPTKGLYIVNGKKVVIK